MHSILCQHFLPSSLALKNSPEVPPYAHTISNVCTSGKSSSDVWLHLQRFSWELDLMRLKHSVNAYVWSHHMLSRQFMKRKHHVR